MESNIILYIVVSLDGFIADKNGSVSWFGGEDANYQGDYGYNQFM